MDNTIIDKLANSLHDIWKEEKENQGFHVPKRCPNFEMNEEDENESLDLIHCNKCMANLIDYDELSDYHKSQYKNKAQKYLEVFEKYGLKIFEKKQVPGGSV